MECRDDYKYNLEAVECLIRSGLLSMQQYDLHVAQATENGLNYSMVGFAMQLVQRFCVEEKPGNTITEVQGLASESILSH